MSAALEKFIERADLGLQLPAGWWAEPGKRLRQHISVLKRIATRTPGEDRVLQKVGGRPVNGTLPLRQSVSNCAGPQA